MILRTILRTVIRVVTLLMCLLLPVAASAGIFDIFKGDEPAQEPAIVQQPMGPTSLPEAAIVLGEQLDMQLVERLNLLEGPAKGYTLIVTTPVNLNNLEQSSPLSRQMGEELSAWFVQSGYKVQEIRKGRTVLFQPGSGEMLLTRRVQLLGNENVRSSIIMASTYSTTMNSIRFNVRLIHAATNEVLAMKAQTIPLNGEMRTLLGGRQGMVSGITAAVGTRLQ